MATQYAHLLLLNQAQKPVKGKAKPRNPRADKEEAEVDIVGLMTTKALDFQRDLRAYNRNLKTRSDERNLDLGADSEIQSVDIEFHGLFNAHDFEGEYLTKYGLALNKYLDMNRRAIFTVADSKLYNVFIEQIEKLIKCKDHNQPNYDGLIKWIKSFKFNSASNRLAEFTTNNSDVVYLSVTGHPLGQSQIGTSIDNLNDLLEGYLHKKTLYSIIIIQQILMS